MKILLSNYKDIQSRHLRLYVCEYTPLIFIPKRVDRVVILKDQDENLRSLDKRKKKGP